VLQRFCGVLLVAALLGLVPVAYADPPDATWLGGYWDDDDFDNIVIAITSACAVVAPAFVDFGPLWTPLLGLEPLQLRFVQVSPHSATSPRAPPR